MQLYGFCFFSHQDKSYAIKIHQNATDFMAEVLETKTEGFVYSFGGNLQEINFANGFGEKACEQLIKLALEGLNAK